MQYSSETAMFNEMQECTIERLNDSFSLLCMMNLAKGDFDFDKQEVAFEELLAEVVLMFQIATKDYFEKQSSLGFSDVLHLIDKFSQFAGINKIDRSNASEKKYANMVAEELATSLSLLLAVVSANEANNPKLVN